MSSYKEGAFIKEFSRRALFNLRDITEGIKLSFEDTALIGFLLAVFVLPHERGDSDTFMKDILADYGTDNLSDVVAVLRPTPDEPQPTSQTNELPKSLADIPAFLRHAVAHLNIKPESDDGQNLTHLLVWNRPHKNRPINFVARVHIRRLRSLALHVLERLSKTEFADKYEQIDPIAEYDTAHSTSAPR